MAELNLEGRVLAEKYELTRLLGQGGMGQVWEARNHLGKRWSQLAQGSFIQPVPQ